MSKIVNFVEYLRAQEEPAKRVWLFVLSGSTMAVVVVLWALYMSVNIEAIPDTRTLAVIPQEESVTETSGGELTANFRKNAAAVGRTFGSLWHRVFGSTEIIIQK